jgi:NADPH-dependent 2,4-dienoyl-CoA reductase/sulfur reductase-like enzyme
VVLRHGIGLSLYEWDVAAAPKESATDTGSSDTGLQAAYRARRGSAPRAPACARRTRASQAAPLQPVRRSFASRAVAAAPAIARVNETHVRNTAVNASDHPTPMAHCAVRPRAARVLRCGLDTLDPPGRSFADISGSAMETFESHAHDVLVIGAGGAGLRAAIEAAQAGLSSGSSASRCSARPTR